MSSSGTRLDPALVQGALEEAVPEVVTDFFDGKVVLRNDQGVIDDGVLPDRLSPAQLLLQFPHLVTSAGATGIRYGTDPTVDPAVTIGNVADSGGWPGTGAPAGTPGALAVNHVFGLPNGQNTPIPKSTQALFVVGSYNGPTSDDSAEAGSASVLLKNTGTAYSQDKQTIAWEATTHVEPNVAATGLVTGLAGRVEIAGTTNQVVSVRASAQTDASSAGTVTEYIAFGQLASPANGTIATKYGVKVKDPILTEDSYQLGASAYSGSVNMKRRGNADAARTLMLITLPTAADEPGTLTGIRIVAPTGQTKSLQEWVGAGAASTTSRVDAGGSIASRVGLRFMDTSFTTDRIKIDNNGLTIGNGENVVFGAGTGSMIGTAVSQKIGFWGAAPVARPSNTPAAASDLASALTLLNFLRTSLITEGLVG